MRIVATALVVCLAALGCGGASSDESSSARSRGPEPGAAADRAAPGAPGAVAPNERSSSVDTPTAPAYREVTLPAGTTLPLQLDSSIASDSSSVEDPVRASIRRPVQLDGVDVLPAGTALSGIVTAAQRSGKVKGRAQLAIRFDTVTIGGEQYDLRTRVISREARGTKARDAKTIGIPAAGGAVVGGIIGGKKGAAIGGAAGGGAGTAVVLSTRGEEVRLPAGTSIEARLADPLTVRVPVP
jgi:hypothetical protein